MVWNIVSDSSCDFLPSTFSSNLIHFESVPLRILVGDREFVDDEELNVPEMLAAMAEEKSASSSSCPSPDAFARAYEKGEKTLCFTISGNLSGTYNAAVMGRELVLEEHPEKQICVIDSRATAGAMVLLIRKTRQLIEENPEIDFEELCEALQQYQKSLRTCFTLECFDNLVKNGRMKPLVGTLLHTLGIHVIADAAPEGVVRVRDKARGEANTFKRMVKLMAEVKDPTDAEVIIAHCNNEPGALRLKKAILDALPVKSVELIPTRGLCSFYAMDKGLIVGF